MTVRSRGCGPVLFAALLALCAILHIAGMAGIDRWIWQKQLDLWLLLQMDRPPDEEPPIEVAMVAVPLVAPYIELPSVEPVPKRARKAQSEKEKEEPEPEQPKPKLAEPPQEPEQPKAPEPELEVRPAPAPPPSTPAPLERMKKVEVADEEHVVEEPPEDAEYLSDKNRRVKEQTRATDTNLEHELAGQRPSSARSDDLSSNEVGGPEEKIRQLTDSQRTSLDAKSKRASRDDRTPRADASKRSSGEEGDGGEGGEGGEGGAPGPLSMRRPADLGPGAGAPALAPGAPGREGLRGQPGKKRPRLELNREMYEKIVGSERIQEEAELAQRLQSHKKGRWEKKREAIQSALENFTPEVRPGNQTALSTRAHPFAVYIARMHRTIHELWGFGFLADLDRKSPSNPMNNPTLEVKMEIAIRADGSVKKVTIAKPSGVTTFDIAAADTVLSAGPYGATPPVIRSSDGNVYLHWTFHRDNRMCNHYFADPFILEGLKAEGQDEGAVADAEASNVRQRPRTLRREAGSPGEGGVPIPHVKRSEAQKEQSVAIPSPNDPSAVAAALSFANAFERGDVAGMVAVSATPFRSGETVVAQSAARLTEILATVLAETKRRQIMEWKLLTAAGFRAVFGHLPAGAEDGSPILLLVIKAGRESLIMSLAPKGGKYKVVGLSRY